MKTYFLVTSPSDGIHYTDNVVCSTMSSARRQATRRGGHIWRYVPETDDRAPYFLRLHYNGDVQGDMRSTLLDVAKW